MFNNFKNAIFGKPGPAYGSEEYYELCREQAKARLAAANKRNKDKFDDLVNSPDGHKYVQARTNGECLTSESRKEYSDYIKWTDIHTKISDEKIVEEREMVNSLTIPNFYYDENLKFLDNLNFLDVPIILKIGLVLIIINLLFKITAAPFNIWAPGIYEGAPLPITMFLSIFSKIAVIFFIIRFCLIHFYEFLTTWNSIFLLCGLGSMVAAILGAISETKIKRFFVYSSMSHVGLMLLALSCGTLKGTKAVLVYLVVYTVTSLGGWTVVMLLINRVRKFHGEKITYITGLKGLSKNNSLLSFFLAFIMFSMGGIPPLAGFFAKFEVLYALTENQLFLYAFIALLLSVISFFYYLRIIKVLYFDPVKNYKLSFMQNQEKGFILAIGFMFTVFFVLYIQVSIFYDFRQLLTSVFASHKHLN